jgi:OHCU decarboxylase
MQLEPHPGSLDRTTFLQRFGGIYETSPWVAEAVFGTDLSDDPEKLAAAMAEGVERADRDRQLTLLKAHPDLAGKLAMVGGLTRDSTFEQTSAGLDSLTPEEFETFQSLNARYRETFGFPFIVAVRGLNKTDIIEMFKKRIENGWQAEFKTALAEVHKIARLRLEALAG